MALTPEPAAADGTAPAPPARGPAPAPGGRRQGERTRRQLLDAAGRVLAQRGYHETRVDDIAEAAGVSHGTFYLYFGDKQELLRELARMCAADMTPIVEQLRDLEPLPPTAEALSAWMARYVRAYDEHAGIFRVWSDQLGDDPVLADLGDAVVTGLVDRLGTMMATVPRAHPADPRAVSLALIALLEQYPHYGLSHERVVNRDNLVPTLTTLVLRGFLGGTPAR